MDWPTALVLSVFLLLMATIGGLLLIRPIMRGFLDAFRENQAEDDDTRAWFAERREKIRRGARSGLPPFKLDR